MHEQRDDLIRSIEDYRLGGGISLGSHAMLNALRAYLIAERDAAQAEQGWTVKMAAPATKPEPRWTVGRRSGWHDVWWCERAGVWVGPFTRSCYAHSSSDALNALEGESK